MQQQLYFFFDNIFSCKKVFKEILAYNNWENMTLFNYGECNMCKLHQSRKRDVLMDVLPADICCKVGEYFGCLRCEKLKENEKHFFKGFTGEINETTKPSHQLAFFKMFSKSLLTTHQTCNDRSGRKYKKEIDRIFDRQSVKDKYVFNKLDLLALKSYCKNDSEIIKLLVWVCHSKKEFDRIFSPFFYSNDNIFTFRNREYIKRDLVKLFLIEYIDDMIGGDKKYCDMEGINKHIHIIIKTMYAILL